MFAPVLKKSKVFSSVTDASKSDEKRASFQFDSILDLPPTSDSGVFIENSRSSNESCDSPLPNVNNPAEKDDFSDEVSSSELSSVEVSEPVNSDGNREKVYADGRKKFGA